MDENLYAPPRSEVADVTPGGPISLYSPRQIYTAAFLSGPLAGTWFLSRNFALISKASESRKAVLIGVAITFGLFPLLLVLPKNMPRIIIPIAYSYPLYTFAKRRFCADTDSRIVFLRGWRSWLRVIGISLAWLVLTLLIWAAAWLITSRFLPNVLPQ